MKAKAKSLTMLIVALLVAAFAVGQAFAWFFESKKADFVINGESAGAYFARGNGTKENPFVITNATHMYNLAWLQDPGRLGKSTKYYFEVDNDFTVPDKMWLPPVGNDEYPFVGEFDGKGHTITNLKITTDSDKLTNYIDGTVFSNAVGVFGMTGNLSDSNKNIIKNFILANPWVEVPSDGKYGSSTAEKVAGIAVGHGAGKCSSIGVRADTGTTYLDVKRTDYSTFNSILGELAKDITTTVTGSAGATGSGGSGNAFGASFDVDSFLTRLGYIYTNKQSSTPSFLLPGVTSSSVLAAGERIAFTVTSVNEENYNGANAAEEVASSNIGYFTGNQNKTATKELTFREKLVEGNNNLWTFSDGSLPETEKKLPNWFYTFGKMDAEGNLTYSKYNYTKDGECGGFRALTDKEYADLPNSIKGLLAVDENYTPLTLSSSKTSKKAGYDTVRLQAQYWGAPAASLTDNVSTTDGNAAWAFHGQISYMGKTYGEGFRDAKGYAVNESGEYLDRYGNVINYQGATFNGMLKGVPLPNNAIWFKPAQTGTIRLVLYSETTGDSFALVKCPRTHASSDDPFALDWSSNADTNGAWSAAYADMEYLFMHQLPARVLFYYEYEITEEDLVNGTYPEFFLCKGNSSSSDSDSGDSGNGAYFVYLDIGSSAAEKVDDTYTVDENSVSAVDFIYDGVEISQEDGTGYKVGDFIVGATLYNPSKTIVFFTQIQTSLKLAFIRLNHTKDEGSQEKTIELCELNDNNNVTGITDTIKANVNATYPEYVIPGDLVKKTLDGVVGGGGGGGGTPVTPNPGGDDTVAVSSVTISGAPTSITVGETATLTATVSPSNATDKTVTWTVTNGTGEATIGESSGVLTASKAGTVTITATAGGVSKSVEIEVKAATVVDPPTPSETWTFNEGTLTDGAISDSNNYVTIAKATGGENLSFVNRTVDVNGTSVTRYLNGKAMSISAGATSVKVTLYVALSNSSGSTLQNGTITISGATTGNGDQTYAKEDFIKIEVTLAANTTCTLTPSGTNRLNILVVEVAPQ